MELLHLSENTASWKEFRLPETSTATAKTSWRSSLTESGLSTSTAMDTGTLTTFGFNWVKKATSRLSATGTAMEKRISAFTARSGLATGTWWNTIRDFQTQKTLPAASTKICVLALLSRQRLPVSPSSPAMAPFTKKQLITSSTLEIRAIAPLPATGTATASTTSACSATATGIWTLTATAA